MAIPADTGSNMKIELFLKPITDENTIKATTTLHNKVATDVHATSQTREKLNSLQTLVLVSKVSLAHGVMGSGRWRCEV